MTREDSKQDATRRGGSRRAGTGHGGDSASENELVPEAKQEMAGDDNGEDAKQIDDVYDLNAVKP